MAQSSSVWSHSLATAGATIVVVEHQPDVISAADWILELGPGGGPDGGRVLRCGPPGRERRRPPTPRKRARRRPRASDAIRVRGASANNLQRIISEEKIDLTIANAENSAGGFGITPLIAQELFGLGLQVLTTGNHSWDKKEIFEYLPR